jgi:hypothetical protein
MKDATRLQNMNALMPMPNDGAARHLARLDRLAALLDSAFRIPGTRWRIGLDGLIGLLPGIGDALTFTIAAGIVGYAAGLGVRPAALCRMVVNLIVDFVIGSVPLLGDIFDVAFKANRRNVNLFRTELHAGRIRKQP